MRSTRKSKGGKIFLLLAVMAGLAGAVIGLIFWLGQFHEPYFLSLAVTEYESFHYPCNAFARQDSDALLKLFSRSRDAHGSQEGRRMKEELLKLSEHRDGSVVVYLSALAICVDGQVFVLAADADPDRRDKDAWLSLDEILDSLDHCPAPHKLLILDIMHPMADARLGILEENVAERTEATLKQRQEQGKLPFHVLCASTSGQVSLVSEELGHSLFAHYLALGVSGGADGYNPEGRRDGGVSVHELFEYVRAHMERWPIGPRQTPRLFGPGRDLSLTNRAVAFQEANEEKSEPQPTEKDLKKESKEPEKDSGKKEEGKVAASDKEPKKEDNLPEYPDWLRKQWEARDVFLAGHGAAPHLIRRLEAVLLREEERWRGGVNTASVQDEVAKETRIADDLDQAKRLIPNEPLEARLGNQNISVQPKDREDLSALLAKVEQPGGKPEQLDAEKKKLREGFKEGSRLAATVYEVVAADQKPTPEKLRFSLELVKDQEGTLPPYKELEFLGTLAAQTKADPEGKWPAEAVHEAIAAEREDAHARTRAFWVLGWVGERLKDLTRQRREALKRLFAPEPESSTSLARLFEKLASDYRALNVQIDTVLEAQRAYDEASATLPGYTSYLLSRDAGPLDKEWHDAVKAAMALGERLAEPSPENAKQCAELHKSLRGHLKKLSQPFSTEAVKALIQRAKEGTQREHAEMEFLLAGPRLSGKDKATLWTAQRQLERRLIERTLRRDREEDQDGRTPRAGESTSPARPSVDHAARARRRAEICLALFELGGLNGRDKLGQDKEDWGKLGFTIRDAWAAMPGQLRQQLQRRELRQAERLARVLDPFDATRAEPDAKNNANTLLLQKQAEQYQKWLDELQP